MKTQPTFHRRNQHIPHTTSHSTAPKRSCNRTHPKANPLSRAPPLDRWIFAAFIAVGQPRFQRLRRGFAGNDSFHELLVTSRKVDDVQGFAAGGAGRHFHNCSGGEGKRNARLSDLAKCVIEGYN
ncbi:hypothetical protein ABFX02_02G120500 [Erythranthe guttata]